MTRELVWVSNRAGLFSHYLSFKLMYHFASKFGRHLLVAPHTSPHYDEATVVDMCSIFDFQSKLSCLPSLIDLSNCTQQLDLRMLNSSTPSICSNAAIKFVHEIPYADDDVIEHKQENTIQKRLNFLHAVDSNPWQLHFTRKYEEIIDTYKSAIGLLNSTDYIVVHWRRGDQKTRCTKQEDRSVNCETASDLITAIKMYVKTGVTVYVATNEDDGKALKAISSAGYKSFMDTKNLHLNKLDLLVAEAGLMIDATTFLAWGVSEMDNVIEATRKARGKSWCVTSQNVSELAVPTAGEIRRQLNNKITRSNFRAGSIATIIDPKSSAWLIDGAARINANAAMDATWCALEMGHVLSYGLPAVPQKSENVHSTALVVPTAAKPPVLADCMQTSTGMAPLAGCRRYRVVHPDGAFVRDGLELSSEIVALLPIGTVIATVEERLNSEAVMRVRLADGQGWTSLYSVNDLTTKVLEEVDS